MVGILAVDIQQQLTQFFELRHGHRDAIDKRPRTAIGIHHPPQYHFTALLVQLSSLHPLQRIQVVLNGKEGANFGFFATGSANTALAASTQGQGQGIDQYRFTGPSLAG